jgi:Zn-dependent peptidase ImmA (M78 family)/transcriptional regulator with XRE-family HTH domain
MNSSDEQFCGQRLRIARFFRGKSQSDVGEDLEISQQYIAEIERRAKEPTDEVADALAELLGFEYGFFYGPTLDEFKDSECNFRRRRVTPVSIRARALAYGTLLGQFWSYATGKLSLPPDRIPVIDASSRDAIERAAERCRMTWGFGLDTPIGNMVRVVEKAGVPVARFGDVGEKVDAFSRAGMPSIVVLSNKAASKCRCDLAHETAHLVLHRDKVTGIPEVEREAERFGRALLLPRAAFGREFLREFPHTHSGDWEPLFRLKRRWKVSVADMILRANDLGIINKVQYLRLYKELSRKGWLKAEPCEFEREAPEILPTVFSELKSQGIDHADIARTLGWKPETLTEITGVSCEQARPPEARGSARILQLGKRRAVEA